jgi:thiol-disulfide isomerase/thioredoxin
LCPGTNHSFGQPASKILSGHEHSGLTQIWGDLPTEILILAARVILTCVLGVAALSKLMDQPRALMLALPVVELAVAAALIVPGATLFGALAASFLLLTFVAAIATNLLRGRRPDCHCFGQLHSEPIGAGLLARNLALAALGIFVTWGVSISEPAATGTGLTPLVRATLVAGALLVSLGAAWLVLRRRDRDARATAPDLTSAAPDGHAAKIAPPFALASLNGQQVALDELRAAGRPVLLLFIDSGCGACSLLLPKVARWQREVADHFTLVTLASGNVADVRAKAEIHALANVVHLGEEDLTGAYSVQGIPGAVLVQPDGWIRRPVANGPEAVQSLVAELTGTTVTPLYRSPTVDESAPSGTCSGGTLGAIDVGVAADSTVTSTPAPLRVGDSVLHVSLADASDSPIRFASFLGNPTVVLFWNPGCPYCQQMLPALQTWEAHPPPGAPRLLVVSAGTADAVGNIGLKVPVAFDPEATAAAALGRQGTPSAILIDAEGRIASPVQLGSQGVLSLAGAHVLTDAPVTVVEPVADRDVFVPADDISSSDIDDELVLYRASTTASYVLNGTAAYVWESFDGSRSIEMIAKDVAEDFGIPYETALADVREIAANFRNQGLLTLTAQ